MIPFKRPKKPKGFRAEFYSYRNGEISFAREDLHGVFYGLWPEDERSEVSMIGSFLDSEATLALDIRELRAKGFGQRNPVGRPPRKRRDVAAFLASIWIASGVSNQRRRGAAALTDQWAEWGFSGLEHSAGASIKRGKATCGDCSLARLEGEDGTNTYFTIPRNRLSAAEALSLRDEGRGGEVVLFAQWGWRVGDEEAFLIKEININTQKSQ